MHFTDRHNEGGQAGRWAGTQMNMYESKTQLMPNRNTNQTRI